MKVKVHRTQAIKQATGVQKWQIAEILNGVKEADQKRFVSPRKVAAFFRKWKAL
jgi:predicted transcriptional regulator